MTHSDIPSELSLGPDELMHSSPDDGRWRIGRFEVLEELDSGGYGNVLRVFDRIARIERAMKIPKDEILISESALRRFVDEARKVSRLNHENIVKVLEVDDSWQVPYIVMELYREGSLSRWIHQNDRGPISPRWAASLVAKIADAVAAIHAAGMLHRDLKPDNVLLERIDDEGPDGLPTFRPLVSDFGIAKFVEDSLVDVPITKSEALLGTIPYMSPEAARGAKQIGPTSDVYGLGAILYTVLTGQNPHKGLTREQTLAKLLSNAPSPSPRNIRPDLDANLIRICRAAMSKAPNDRYRSARAMAEDLRRYADGIEPKTVPWWKRQRAWVRTRPKWLVASCAAIVVFAALSSGYVLKKKIDATVWLDRIRAASATTLPELMRSRPSDWFVKASLESLTRTGNDAQKRAASVALSRSGHEHSGPIVDWLLGARPEEIGLICRALESGPPHLIEELIKKAGSGQGTETSRANASLALVHLGRTSDGLARFLDIRDPGARAMLVHSLGPSGVSARMLIEVLEGAKTAPAICRGLLLALGEVPAGGWKVGDRERAEKVALQHYENDPDSGVHGSAKWLLKSWRLGPQLAKIDQLLSKLGHRPTFHWRVGPSGITFVRFDVVDRVIEIADTELTIATLRLLDIELPDHVNLAGAVDLPATALNYLLAAEICNAITLKEKMERTEFCYQPGRTIAWEPVPKAIERTGIRMPLDTEFPVYVRAGTGNNRPYGGAFSLANRYVTTVPRGPLRLVQVATSKPNDLGLFDTLGSVAELGQWTVADVKPGDQAALFGGNLTGNAPDFSATTVNGSLSVRFTVPLSLKHGLRVVRTLEVRNAKP